MTKTVTIQLTAPTFANVTPGVVKQAEEFLRSVTTDAILKVVRMQPGEPFIIRCDNRWDRRIPQATRKIQAFWQIPGSGRLLNTIWSIIQSETYRYPKRRTGHLGASWQVYVKTPLGGISGALGRIGYDAGNSLGGSIPRTQPKRVGTTFPENVVPGAVYTFLNVAKYGSLMSRYSAILALRGSIAKSVAKSKSDTNLRIDSRLKKLARSEFYKATPRGYSTVTRIKAAGRRAALKTQAIVKAFDIPAPGTRISGQFGYLKRLSGVSVTYFKYFKRSDVAKQGRLV